MYLSNQHARDLYILAADDKSSFLKRMILAQRIPISIFFGERTLNPYFSGPV